MEKDHSEIILEDIQSKFELILEGHASLHRKIDTVYRDLNEKIEMNSFKIDTLNKKIDDVEGSLRNKINRVEPQG